MQIYAHPLRDQVRDALVEWLEMGRLQPGTRLEEVRLAETFSVSRTPLREALRGLEQEGLVESSPNRGFRVPSLNEQVVRELYPIIAALESLALRLGGLPNDAQIAELHDLNRKMAGPGLETRTRYTLDRRWHDTLIAHNPNGELGKQLVRLKRRVMFYDGSWDRGLAAVEKSCAQHQRTADFLTAGELDNALAALDQHYVDGIEIVADWLQSRCHSQ
jgi:DNA-binding GntR family transcriptional regulator